MKINCPNKRPGWIISGPSEGDMFKSLHSEFIVEITFLLSDNSTASFRAKVISIGRDFSEEIKEKNYWKIKLMVENGRSSNWFSDLWIGEYSTLHKRGIMTGMIPKCLVKLYVKNP